MTDEQKSRAFEGLRAKTRRWVEDVCRDYELEDHHVMTLTLIAQAWDRIHQARELIRLEGMTIKTRDGGRKLHPACRVEDASRTAFARLLRELDLDVAPPAEAKRPPMLQSMRGRRTS